MGTKQKILIKIVNIIYNLPNEILRTIILSMGDRGYKIAKLSICAMLIVLFLAPSFASAETIKTAPLKSFFARFVKDKKDDADKADKAVVEKKSGIFFKKKQKDTVSADSNVALIQGGVTLSIDDCVGVAIKNDPNIKNYISTQKAQKSAVGIARSSYFPTITGGTGYYINNTRYNGDKTNTVNNNYYGLNLSVNEMIWDFGYTHAKINMNKFNWEAAGYDVEKAILDTTYAVKIYYTSVLASRANMDIYARSVRINELNVERTKAMYEVGLKSKIDLVNAQATLTDAKIKLINAQESYQVALINLNNAMYYTDAPDYLIKDTETFSFQKNYSIKNEIDVAYDRKNYDPNSIDAKIKDGAILTSGIEKKDIIKTYNFKPFDLTMAEAIKKAYENRPDIKSLELVKRASDEALKMYKRSYMPQIGATANYSLAQRSDYGYNAVGVFAGVDLPNINPVSIKYQIEQGKAYLDIAATNVDLLKKNVYFQIQTYYVSMKKLERTIPLMSQKVEETLENFELADGRYAVGLGNYLELQQAQTDYNNAQLAFVESVFEYNQARFYLEKAMGVR